MSKLSSLAGGYKGGTGFISSPKPKQTEEEKRNSDIEQFLEVLKNDYYNNDISKIDLNFYKECIKDLKNDTHPTTNLSSISNKKLQDLIAFTKMGIESNKINKSHLQQKIDGIDNILKTTFPKIIDQKPPPKTEGKLNSLSPGYKKK